ncbi:sulfatase [Novipirellula sp. SH528]|uniref:sulfatase n=1 Tax=Novipirellula sp. SH528 TaxID=3454466 RepID=UPI003FA09D4A
MKTLIATAAVLTLALSGLAATEVRGATPDKPNILFIAVDDLRPELGCYGSEIAVTPNMDALAKAGLRFNRAYCQQAICGPSRASLLTGTRPDTNGITHNYVKIRELNPDIVTLPQHFGVNGYDTVYMGKIFHHGDLDEASWNRQPSKNRPEVRNLKKPVNFALPENKKSQMDTRKQMIAKYGDVAKLGLAMGPAYESADVPDNTYGYGYHTDLAIATLKDLVAEDDKPFFLALGFNKPHLNWVAPKRYWDMYDRDAIPMATQTEGPQDGAAVGLHPSFELRVRSGIPKLGAIDPQLARTLKHAYLACVSYVDAQVGRMIAALDEAGVRDNTIIILWSDHGYHLGDMGMWCKATNYELATRVPMMIWTPDMPAASQGKSTDALVELVDIYPTLCDLAVIEQPAHLEGTSFKPLIRNPAKEWKTAAFNQFPSPALREWGSFPIRPAMRETYFGPLLDQVEDRIEKQMGAKWDRELFEHDLTGYAMRTDHYRLVAWKDTKHPDAAPLFTELYDHGSDPAETKNVAAENPELVAELLTQLDRGWKAAVPAAQDAN